MTPASPDSSPDVIEVDAADLEPTASGSYNFSLIDKVSGAVRTAMRVKNVVGALAHRGAGVKGTGS